MVNGTSFHAGKEAVTVKPPTPPPIFVQGVTNFSGMMDRLKKIVTLDSITTKMLANNVVKVVPNSPDAYRKLVSGLSDIKIQFYTYQLKTERAFKVVVCNLHPTIETEEIKKALTDLGYVVRNVVNIRNRSTKEPLPLFFVDLEPCDDNKSIYDLTALLHSRVKVEAPRPRREAVQCKRCQRYGHTKTYCTMTPVCVKCGGDHDNRECPKTREAAPTCGLCGGPHTANYRGCPEYKSHSLRNIRRDAAAVTHTRPTPSNAPNVTGTASLPPTTSNGRDKRSYTEAATESAQTTTQIVGNTANRLEVLLEQMLTQNKQIIDLLVKLVTKLL